MHDKSSVYLEREALCIRTGLRGNINASSLQCIQKKTHGDLSYITMEIIRVYDGTQNQKHTQ